MEEPVSATAPAPILFRKRKAPASQTLRKRPPTPPAAAIDSESDSDDASSDDDASQPGARIKRRKTAGIAATSTRPTTNDPSRPADLKPGEFAAEATTTIAISDDATRQSNWQDLDTAPKPSATTKIDTKSLLGSTRAMPSKEAGDAPKPVVGPQKAASTVRMITVTDFAPDVCKDYKQTGFCGFGDSCKFLHAREDYKQGWELDKDWEIGTKGKKSKGTTVGSRGARAKDEVEEADEEMLESIPFACVICKESYKNPIVTKCRHYFCEACALKRYRKSPNCAICATGTGGVFNGAKGLKKLLEKKKEREKRRREEEGEEGSDVEDFMESAG